MCERLNGREEPGEMYMARIYAFVVEYEVVRPDRSWRRRGKGSPRRGHSIGGGEREWNQSTSVRGRSPPAFSGDAGEKLELRRTNRIFTNSVRRSEKNRETAAYPGSPCNNPTSAAGSLGYFYLTGSSADSLMIYISHVRDVLSRQADDKP